MEPQEIEILIQNNQLLFEMVEGQKKLINLLERNQVAGVVDTCTPAEALQILGTKNPRFLTYFVKQGLLNRRKGGTSYLYFKKECIVLAEKLNRKVINFPTAKGMYADAKD